MKLLGILFVALPIQVLIAQNSPSTRFDRWDQDKNGKLTRNELPENLRRNFDRVDTNQDGFISREEDAAVGSGGRRSGRTALPDNVSVLADQDYAGRTTPSRNSTFTCQSIPKAKSSQ